MNAISPVRVADVFSQDPLVPDWRLALVLGVAMGIASILALPYVSAMTGKPLTRATVAVTGAKSALFGFLVASVGLGLGESIGLDAPLLRSWIEGTPFRGEAHWLTAALVGAVAAFGLLMVNKLFLASRVAASAPRAPRTPTPATRWQGALASFSGGIGEEIQWRLFLTSALAWGLVKVSGSMEPWGFMTAIALAAVAFAAAHLPLAAQVWGSLRTIVVVQTLFLNTFVGIVFGVLYWRWGLEHAMVAHFCADIVIHVIVRA